MSVSTVVTRNLFAKRFGSASSKRILVHLPAFRTSEGPSQLLNGKHGTGFHEVFRYPGEYTFNLAEYMVVLDKPLGLCLAPDPVTGQITVQKVLDGSTAAACQLIQVGDILKKCGGVEDMIPCVDMKTTKWAFGRPGKVKLVLERGKSLGLASWCCAGKPGMASCVRETLQLPVQLDRSPDASANLPVRSKCMLVGFHRHTERFPQKERRRTGAEARAARTQELREQLLSARVSPLIDLTLPRRAAQNHNGSCNGATVSLTPLESLTQPFVNAAWLVGGRRMAVNQKKVVAALPWLFVATKRLSTKDLNLLASQEALSCVMELALQMQGGVMGVRGSVNAGDASPQGPLRALISTAASLNRLKYRRQSYLSSQQWRPVSCGVLVHCDENMEAEVGKLLACWLHWYGGLDLNESTRAAQETMGCRVPRGVIADATALLLDMGKERVSHVLLTWPYGGLAADVCGDLVGGWDVRVPLKRWPAETKAGSKPMPGQFFLELKGLKPGCYHYKYIVDGTWTVDHYAPKALDASGNWNNCLYVSALPSVETAEERLYLARLEAANQCFETKMGLPMRHSKG